MTIHPDTYRGVNQVISMLQKLKSEIHHNRSCGPLLRVVHTTSQGPVKLTLKFSRGLSGAYEVAFNLAFDSNTTETQVIDAMKRATAFLANCPRFLPEETPDILLALDELLGPIEVE
jgi:hypothetical protein